MWGTVAPSVLYLLGPFPTPLRAWLIIVGPSGLGKVKSRLFVQSRLLANVGAENNSPNGKAINVSLPPSPGPAKARPHAILTATFLQPTAELSAASAVVPFSFSSNTPKKL